MAEKNFSIYDTMQQAVEVIDNNVESDFEVDGYVSYYFKYSTENNAIEFYRETSCRTGEYYSDGGIDTKSYNYASFSVQGTVTDYCNMAIRVLQNQESYVYKFGEDVKCIGFKPIY